MLGKRMGSLTPGVQCEDEIFCGTPRKKLLSPHGPLLTCFLLSIKHKTEQRPPGPAPRTGALQPASGGQPVRVYTVTFYYLVYKCPFHSL